MDRSPGFPPTHYHFRRWIGFFLLLLGGIWFVLLLRSFYFDVWHPEATDTQQATFWRWETLYILLGTLGGIGVGIVLIRKSRRHRHRYHHHHSKHRSKPAVPSALPTATASPAADEGKISFDPADRPGEPVLPAEADGATLEPKRVKIRVKRRVRQRIRKRESQ